MEREGQDAENGTREPSQPSFSNSEKQTVTDFSPATPTNSLKPGTVFGRYRIQRELGSGGLGKVYLAEDPTLRRQVAVKIMLESSQSSSGFQRFAREAEA